jgi:hypothetical protein
MGLLISQQFSLGYQLTSQRHVTLLFGLVLLCFSNLALFLCRLSQSFGNLTLLLGFSPLSFSLPPLQPGQPDQQQGD